MIGNNSAASKSGGDGTELVKEAPTGIRNRWHNSVVITSNDATNCSNDNAETEARSTSRIAQYMQAKVKNKMNARENKTWNMPSEHLHPLSPATPTHAEIL